MSRCRMWDRERVLPQRLSSVRRLHTMWVGRKGLRLLGLKIEHGDDANTRVCCRRVCACRADTHQWVLIAAAPTCTDAQSNRVLKITLGGLRAFPPQALVRGSGEAYVATAKAD